MVLDTKSLEHRRTNRSDYGNRFDAFALQGHVTMSLGFPHVMGRPSAAPSQPCLVLDHFWTNTLTFCWLIMFDTGEICAALCSYPVFHHIPSYSRFSGGQPACPCKMVGSITDAKTMTTDDDAISKANHSEWSTMMVSTLNGHSPYVRFKLYPINSHGWFPSNIWGLP